MAEIRNVAETVSEALSSQSGMCIGYSVLKIRAMRLCTEKRRARNAVVVTALAEQQQQNVQAFQDILSVVQQAQVSLEQYTDKVEDVLAHTHDTHMQLMHSVDAVR
jgi:hypothetical protein